MRSEGVSGRTITLKVKYSDFVQITRSATVAALTSDGHTVFSTACELMEKTDVGRKPIRLLGVSVSQLSHCSISAEQLSLFGEGERLSKRKNLNSALDSVSERFGENALRPATLLTK
jgi:DNA polymerase-4